jgi:hypothetical protein
MVYRDWYIYVQITIASKLVLTYMFCIPAFFGGFSGSE